MAENAATFAAVTGAPLEQAEMYLEMAGGDMEQAVAIFFANQDVAMDAADGGAAPPAEEPAAGAVGSKPAPAWWHVVWPAVEEPPEAWTRQRLDCGEGWPGGIPQPSNGPCGVLAVVHGLMLAGQHSRKAADIQVSPQAAAEAIAGILARCRPDEGAPIRLARPRERGNYRPDVELEEQEFSDLAAAAAEIRARVEDFRGPGGLIDLVYSAVMTRGIEQVRIDATAEGGELPLVIRQFNCWLCTTELMSLLLRGKAEGNVGQFKADGTLNESWEGALVGILSRSEKESGMPVADALKSPKAPVWILHGGDHFTVAWAKAMPAAEAGSKFVLHHWNGLPPGGPRLAEIGVAAVRGAVASGSKEAPKFYKPVPGEVDDLVQADPDDKKAFPDKYRQWRYEVLLAWDDPSVQGEPRPPDATPEPTFDQEDARYQRPGPWRCRLCYAKRFQTMDFALVPADSLEWCPKCQKTRKECGWSLWMPFVDLPSRFQATIMDRFATKFETILWTKWPAAEIEAVAGRLPDC